MTESSRLFACSRRSRRSASVLPSPNNRSNTICGLFSIGSGNVAVFHDSVLRYAQVKSASQFKPTGSIESSMEGSGVSWPMCCAAT